MIGIIGGIGPTAGADLLQKITGDARAKKDQKHLPVILFSLPQQIENRIKAAVACNTAHAPKIVEKAEKELKKSGSQLQLLHLINENIAYHKADFKKAPALVFWVQRERTKDLFR